MKISGGKYNFIYKVVIVYLNWICLFNEKFIFFVKIKILLLEKNEVGYCDNIEMFF